MINKIGLNMFSSLAGLNAVFNVTYDDNLCIALKQQNSYQGAFVYTTGIDYHDT